PTTSTCSSPAPMAGSIRSTGTPTAVGPTVGSGSNSERFGLSRGRAGVKTQGRVAQTALDWVAYRNDRVVRLKQGLQRDEPRDATAEAGFLLTLQEEVALPPRCAWDFDGPARCARSGSWRSSSLGFAVARAAASVRV